MPTRFAPVPSSPNCVSSRAPASDTVHHIAPLQGVSFEAVRDTLLGWPRTAVVEEAAGYLHVVCKTPLIGFKDDLEIELEGETVHIRSASRVGYSDLGANRKRVEALRKELR